MSLKKVAFFLSFLSAASLAKAAPILESRLQPGGFYMGKTKPGAVVIFKEREVRVADDGRFVLGFGREAKLKQSYRVEHPNKATQQVNINLKPRTYDIEKITGVVQKYVTPANSVLKRIRNEAVSVGSARKHDTEGLDFFAGMTQPARGRITGVYGSQRFFNGEPRRPHYGVDFAGSVGKPVIAAADGVVRLAEDDLYFSGGTIILDHGHGISTSYLHLSGLDVEVGDVVRRGERIGAIGATGRVTGPHLDWRLNWFDVRLDPALMTPDYPVSHR